MYSKMRPEVQKELSGLILSIIRRDIYSLMKKELLYTKPYMIRSMLIMTMPSGNSILNLLSMMKLNISETPAKKDLIIRIPIRRITSITTLPLWTDGSPTKMSYF